MRPELGDALLHRFHRRREFALPVQHVAQREVRFEKHIRIAAPLGVTPAAFREFSTCLQLAREEVERRLPKEDTKQLRRVAELYAKFARPVEGALHLRRSEPSRD